MRKRNRFAHGHFVYPFWTLAIFDIVYEEDTLANAGIFVSFSEEFWPLEKNLKRYLCMREGSYRCHCLSSSRYLGFSQHLQASCPSCETRRGKPNFWLPTSCCKMARKSTVRPWPKSCG